MGVTVLGIQHRVGEFQGVHYDNYNSVSYTHLDVYKRQITICTALKKYPVILGRGEAVLRMLKRFPPTCTIRPMPLIRFYPVSYTQQMCIRDS